MCKFSAGDFVVGRFAIVDGDFYEITNVHPEHKEISAIDPHTGEIVEIPFADVYDICKRAPRMIGINDDCYC